MTYELKAHTEDPAMADASAGQVLQAIYDGRLEAGEVTFTLRSSTRKES